MKENILVIEDDRAIRNLIKTTLTTFGYGYHFAENGEDAIKQALFIQPDLYVLDLGLPDMDGNEIIIKLRTWTNNPIIVVSARNEISDKITALNTGADDYLTKPFSVEELLARIRVALRKSAASDSSTSETTFINGDMHIDYAAGSVWMKNKEVRLTPIEYRILCLMAKNVGKVLTHDYILDKIWGENALNTDTQSLRVFMATLRKKLEETPSDPQYLQTRVGVGYCLVRRPDSM